MGEYDAGYENCIDSMVRQMEDMQFRIDSLHRENAKLRELLGKVIATHDKMCTQRGNCFGCVYFDGELKTPFSQMCMPLANSKEARELGIEVDDA